MYRDPNTASWRLQKGLCPHGTKQAGLAPGMRRISGTGFIIGIKEAMYGMQFERAGTEVYLPHKFSHGIIVEIRD